MPPVVHSFDPPERFVAGTVGEPGGRTFFLQARVGNQLTSVALEKQQVQILAERIEELLDELLQAEPTSTTVPALTPAGMADDQPLDQPIEEEFRAGTITLSWDPEDERIVVEVFPVTEQSAPIESDEEGIVDLPIEEPEPEEILLVRLPAAMARAFSQRAASVVAAGRPPCPFCGGPVDAEGHLCPRANGFRRRQG
ncbi:MAG: DUF3090 family protein [Actinomycetota bacterium]|nr:DUF3090 family protein [Actinomycetota bacterium]